MQRLQELDGQIGPLFVPEINDLQLVVRFPLQQPAARPRAQHLREPFGLVAAGKHQEEAQDLRRRRRDVGVVPVEPDAEVGVVEVGVERDRSFERRLDALAVAGGRQLLVAQHPPLHARA